jgi:hypothetical protein
MNSAQDTTICVCVCVPGEQRPATAAAMSRFPPATGASPGREQRLLAGGSRCAPPGPGSGQRPEDQLLQPASHPAQQPCQAARPTTRLLVFCTTGLRLTTRTQSHKGKHIPASPSPVPSRPAQGPTQEYTHVIGVTHTRQGSHTLQDRGHTHVTGVTHSHQARLDASGCSR